MRTKKQPKEHITLRLDREIVMRYLLEVDRRRIDEGYNSTLTEVMTQVLAAYVGVTNYRTRKFHSARRHNKRYKAFQHFLHNESPRISGMTIEEYVKSLDASEKIINTGEE